MAKFLLILSMIFSIKVFAGPSISGGGDAVTTSGEIRLLDLVERDQVEYFVPDLNQYKSQPYYWPRLWHLSPVSPFAEFPCVSIYPALMTAIGLYYKEPFEVDLQFFSGPVFTVSNLTWALTDQPLENVRDEGYTVISTDNIKQLAIQKDGLVVIQKNLFNALSDEDKFALYSHEALVAVVSKLNPLLLKNTGTASLRTFNRQLLQYATGLIIPEKAFPLSVVRNSCVNLFPESVQKKF